VALDRTLAQPEKVSDFSSGYQHIEIEIPSCYGRRTSVIAGFQLAITFSCRHVCRRSWLRLCKLGHQRAWTWVAHGFRRVACRSRDVAGDQRRRMTETNGSELRAVG
jgi:hypothetical protein